MTVTAEMGTLTNTDDIAQRVNVIGSDTLNRRIMTGISDIVEAEPGLAAQRTSPGIAGIFVRGLLGKNVAVYRDGVRFTSLRSAEVSARSWH